VTDGLQRVSVTWSDVERLVGTLLRALPGDYDNLLVITRGGMVPACLISERTGIRNILCAAVVLYDDVDRTLAEPAFVQFPEDRHVRGRRILVVDDVWDSGSTIVAVRERLRKAGARVQTCVLHYKPGRSRYRGDGPDFYAETTDDWVVYPWDPVNPLPG
jgi:hypoxanthine phosphoribosyltransferase